MIVCPACRQPNPENARYCMQCGTPLERPAPETGQLKPRLDIFALSLLGSLILTVILSVILGWPVFILGAFLPFFWLRRKRS